MATILWRGGVEAVAQVADATVDTYDAASTYTITIGDYTVSTSGDGSVTAVATALATACNGLAHPYFAAITWSDATGTITATADVAGVPFVAALSVSGGTGTVTDFADTTACAGPHHADDAENYEGGALPTNGDDLVLTGGPSILYGLTGITAVALVTLEIRQSFTGAVGLLPHEFATSLDAATRDAGYLEYRVTHLDVDADLIIVGQHDGPGSPLGSGRVHLDQQSTAASVLRVVNTGTPAGAGVAVDYLAADADADVEVESAPGGVGIASYAGASATVGDVTITDRTAASAVYVGAGATLTDLTQSGGQNALAATAVTSISVDGGELSIRGDGFLIGTLTIRGGTVTDTHYAASGVDWTTVNVYGGTLVLPRVKQAEATRSWTTMNLSRGRVEGDWSALSGTVAIDAAAGVSPEMAIDATDQ